MNSGSIKYAHEMIDGEWDIICAFHPYQGTLYEPVDEQFKVLDKRITALNLLADEGYWHIIWANNNDISYITTKRSGGMVIQRNSFSEATLEKFAAANFKPLECAEFKYAVFFRNDVTSQRYNETAINIILGEFER